MHFQKKNYIRLIIFCFRLFPSLLFFSHACSLLEMEFETYESELADYSLQDSPFYEANTPIIFGLTASTQNIFASNNSTSMVDALNLSPKKFTTSSSIMMSSAATKCQSLNKLAFERSTNTNLIGKCNNNDGPISINNGDAIGSSSKKRSADEMADRFYSLKNTDLVTNNTTVGVIAVAAAAANATAVTTNTETNMQTKKKRKCVSFLPNYVQVI